LKTLSILGSTGSIGVSTLEIIATYPDRYRVAALGAGRNIDLLQQQIERFAPRLAAVVAEADAALLRERLGDNPVEIVHGVAGMIRCATLDESEMLVAAIVGAAGLVPTMAAIQAGKDIALANKETLVMAGELVMKEVAGRGVKLLPIDSEHSAIFQSLAGQRREDVRRLILTASGGPFRDWDIERFAKITPADALAHPTWDMGRKISIDSATMMNKGLEVIEAYWLFGVAAQSIDVVIHPQSIVHSMVEYRDGAVMAQLGIADMKTPIAYALSWPERLPLPQPALDLCQIAQLSFSAPDPQRFPCPALAFRALEQGGTLPAVLNAANEIAVEAFLANRLSFVQIPRLIEKVMDAHQHESLTAIAQVLRADLWARSEARKMLQGGIEW
jgi:1-deoxy-D-xylulose-5-phosphate reductoisomerase